ncbi:hypothetical protein Pan44_42420 [Caulifigura coniformis]|uniref:Golvesin/Xly CBD-like domain-containing protein n=1 Tax=Caulifigura coniformis TaxID=2527983 RepID=A0A517SJ85_9PLAN|nr:hypothetical protein [Caulifigura coniformis]QDT56190.1 hypothetical protein Pan44_42420 [Caulifigura coniformis]
MLGPGGTATLSVQLDAAAAGSFSGLLSFATNDPDENPFQFTIAGSVTSPSAVQIIDNGDAGYTTTGAWTSWSQDGHGSDLQWSHSSEGPATATWTFTSLIPGTYRVSATWLAASNRATNAAYSMRTATGGLLGSALVNQQLVPNDLTDQGSEWDHLGIVSLIGSTLVVELTNVGADQYIIADAIRIERIGD